MGKNITGWIRLVVKGCTAGAVVIMHFGEAQHENGAINTSSNNAAHQRDEYTIRAVAQTGTFDCGSDLINKIHRCTLQSQLCNVQMGVPTDDTQRPERLGWGGRRLGDSS